MMRSATSEKASRFLVKTHHMKERDLSVLAAEYHVRLCVPVWSYVPS